MDAPTTGCRIAACRRKKNLTQKELAERLHVSAAAVSKWERGINYPDLSLMEPLAEALETTAVHLLALENAPTEQVIRQVVQVSREETHRNKWSRAVQLCAAYMVLLALILPLAFAVGQDALFTWLYDLGILNLAALALGFAGWIAAGCGMFYEGKRRLVLVCISLACCALSLYVPTLIVDLEMRFGHWDTVEDTIRGYHFGALVLIMGTGLLNAMGWKRKNSRGG